MSNENKNDETDADENDESSLRLSSDSAETNSEIKNRESHNDNNDTGATSTSGNRKSQICGKNYIDNQADNIQGNDNKTSDWKSQSSAQKKKPMYLLFLEKLEVVQLETRNIFLK